MARILAKHADDLLPTELPANVYDLLKASPVTDVHVFARRGPAQVKFSPLELRELGHVPDVDVIVYPEDFDFDEGSMAAIHSSNQTKQVVKTLTDWTLKEPEENTASRRIHLHFLHKPVEVLGEDGRVVGVRTERTALNGDGNVTGTGQTHDWPVQAVYRAVGYFGSPLVDIPFDDVAGVIPNREGRVVDVDGEQLPGVYATGWIKRGPVGLIGHTKSDASETIRHLGEDVAEGGEAFYTATDRDPAAVVEFLHGRSVDVIQWHGWELLDAYERGLGEPHGRERIKLVPRDEMVSSPWAATDLHRPGLTRVRPTTSEDVALRRPRPRTSLSQPVGSEHVAARARSVARTSRLRAREAAEELACAFLAGVVQHARGRPAFVHAAPCRKQTSSATSRANTVSWVATTIVRPVRLSPATTDRTSRAAAG